MKPTERDLSFLDFDITLADDAARFGLKAQGDACVDDTDAEVVAPSLPPIPTVPPEPVDVPVETVVAPSEPKRTGAIVSPTFKEAVVSRVLYDALVIAKETYGETNSEHSEVFCHWVDDALQSFTTVRETKEMLEILHQDKEGFSGRLSATAADYVAARRHASICAMNIVRAMLNNFRGLSCEQWIERSLYRAMLAEGDIKGEI